MHGLSVLLVSLAISASGGESPQGVLLEFSATWCGPCQQMSPVVRRLERQGYPIRKIDVDRDASLAGRFRITSIPAFVLVVNGKEVTRCVGLQTETNLKRLMARIPQAAGEQQMLASSSSPASQNGRTERNALASSAAEETPKRGILPRFPLPLFGSKKKEDAVPSSAGEAPPVIRAKYDRPRETRNGKTRSDPLAASTRIRIKDATGINYGSGTIIDSRPGRTIVLTCGHIFRDLKPQSTIEVDVLDGEAFERYVGEALRYDLESDVGLIAIASDVPLPTAHVAGADYRVSIGGRLVSIGCGGGEPPSKESIRVTALNRYLGPDNVECTGVPEQGRSGGGLFSAEGEVTGVCVAADPRDERGLYAGLNAVHDLLDRADLSHLYGGRPSVAQSREKRETAGQPAPGRLSAASDSREVDGVAQSTATAVTTPDPSRRPEDARLAATRSHRSAAGVPADTGRESAPDTGSVRDANPAAVAAQASRSAATIPADSDEAEVICIIRPLVKPRSASRVVIINRASPKFLSYLRGELDQQLQPTTARSISSTSRDAESSQRRILTVSRDAESSERSATSAIGTTDNAARETTAPPEARDGWQTARGQRSTIPEFAKPLPASSTPQRYRRSAASRELRQR